MPHVSRRAFTGGLLASVVPANSAVGQPNDPGSIAIVDTPNNAAKVASKLSAQNVKVVVRFFARKGQVEVYPEIDCRSFGLLSSTSEASVKRSATGMRLGCMETGSSTASSARKNSFHIIGYPHRVQRRFTIRTTPVFKERGGGSGLIDRPNCKSDNHVPRNANVRILAQSGAWSSVDIDEDGNPDGYVRTSDLTSNLATMPLWKPS
jgi:hypothetical protein